MSIGCFYRPNSSTDQVVVQGLHMMGSLGVRTQRGGDTAVSRIVLSEPLRYTPLHNSGNPRYPTPTSDKGTLPRNMLIYYLDPRDTAQNMITVAGFHHDNLGSRITEGT